MIACSPCPLTKALLALLPGASFIGRKQVAWHSATFAGERITIELQLDGEDRATKAAHFSHILLDTEFDLRRQLVADIIVSNMMEGDDGLVLTVEALLLDE